MKLSSGVIGAILLLGITAYPTASDAQQQSGVRFYYPGQPCSWLRPCNRFMIIQEMSPPVVMEVEPPASPPRQFTGIPQPLNGPTQRYISNEPAVGCAARNRLRSLDGRSYYDTCTLHNGEIVVIGLPHSF